ncbi:tryptophan synthase, alpha chain [Ekhidna lutea]|uniref:Tryptophan synthase alpha chain n=1 Tax=Ekhidna lutea TaxID=447679 RepID=A0A239M134_EKHLU|nr:tryptophan synthase subunit alpha [Ekhidna lutea]SNT36456.1 tryptophan synthase, alpha chain [Ekhidna lutea]
MEKLTVMNRIDHVFIERNDTLNVYFTAGYPVLDDTISVARSLEEAGADMLEIGIPFSDPVADGPTIQESSQQALENGMTIEVLFGQLKSLREHVTIPVLLMGYVNPIIQYGIERFCDKCAEVGIDGVIVPDLPMQEYLDHYEANFKEKGIHNIFLISPNTTETRIREIDENSSGFIYVVSSSSITGAKTGVQEGQLAYYQRIQEMKLKNRRLIGFGISDKETYQTACKYADGAIIGSAFIKQLKNDASDSAIKEFVKGIKK